MVLPKEFYPEYEYVQLSPENIRRLELENQRAVNAEDYVTYATSEECQCVGAQKEQVTGSECRKLQNAEYKTHKKLLCANSKLFTCFTYEQSLLGKRAEHTPPFSAAAGAPLFGSPHHEKRNTKYSKRWI
jgi:hypothetical protein